MLNCRASSVEDWAGDLSHSRRLLRCSDKRRDSDLHKCAWIGVGQPQIPTELFCPLAHSSDADANTPRTQLRDWIFHALAVISDGHHHMAFSLRETDPGSLRTRMPINIGESLLNDTEDGSFQLDRESRELAWLNFQRGLNAAALGQTVQVPTKR